MKQTKRIIFGLACVLSLQAHAGRYSLFGSGFQAPAVNGETIADPQLGDIIFDNTAGAFKGYDGSGWLAFSPSTPTAPTVQTFTSGSGTYTTPAGVAYIRVRMVGGGGGGGCGNTTANGGGGGGAGGYVDVIVPSPSATYSYAVGSGGSGGSAGTNGATGGNGATGYIEITEYYN
jgi:hypothetical protein